MSNKDTGGPAFPVPANEPIHSGAPGMTMRDWFAGLAMQGLLSADVELQFNHVTIASMAYGQADAMLEARNQTMLAAMKQSWQH